MTEEVFMLQWTSTVHTNLFNCSTIHRCLTLLFQEMTDVCSTSRMQNVCSFCWV